MVRISLIMHLSSISDAVARQGEEEGRALLGDTLGPGAAAMSGDNAADSRQADAGAGKRRRLVQTLEYAEQLVDVAHVESSAVVANPENALFPYVVVADFDDRVLRSRRILYRIVQEVLPCELHHGGIRDDDGQWSQAPRDSAILDVRHQDRANLLDQRLHVDGLKAKRVLTQSRIDQEVLDQRGHPPR